MPGGHLFVETPGAPGSRRQPAQLTQTYSQILLKSQSSSTARGSLEGVLGSLGTRNGRQHCSTEESMLPVFN